MCEAGKHMAFSFHAIVEDLRYTINIFFYKWTSLESITLIQFCARHSQMCER